VQGNTLELTGNRSRVLFDSGDEITVQAGSSGIRFLLVSGKPLKESVAWRGTIMMNTDEESRQANAEPGAGTFIRRPSASQASRA
jgi:redox-sensitive bicupin YhaK (pirin superfamily)